MTKTKSMQKVLDAFKLDKRTTVVTSDIDEMVEALAIADREAKLSAGLDEE